MMKREIEMPDYPKMYAILCAAASEAIDLLAEGKQAEAMNLLQSALSEAEDLYIGAEVVLQEDGRH
jgi:hypothetical protein